MKKKIHSLESFFRRREHFRIFLEDVRRFMYHFIGFSIGSAIFLVFISGCTETIEVDLETDARRLVVEGMVVSGNPLQYVRLTESVPFLQDSPSPPVSEASVIISDGDQSVRLFETLNYAGVFVSQNGLNPTPGDTFTLSISNVDINGNGEMEEYSASSYMPGVVSPDSIDVVYDRNWNVWKVLLYAEDNPDTQDFYMFRVFENGALISDNISEYSIVSDKFFDGGRAEGVWVQSINADDGEDAFQGGDVITLQMCGITEKYYDFIEGVQRENRGRYPLFSGPPANVQSNISNNALGFFTAFSASYASYRFVD